MLNNLISWLRADDIETEVEASNELAFWNVFLIIGIPIFIWTLMQ